MQAVPEFTNPWERIMGNHFQQPRASIRPSVCSAWEGRKDISSNMPKVKLFASDDTDNDSNSISEQGEPNELLAASKTIWATWNGETESDILLLSKWMPLLVARLLMNCPCNIRIARARIKEHNNLDNYRFIWSSGPEHKPCMKSAIFHGVDHINIS